MNRITKNNNFIIYRDMDCRRKVKIAITSKPLKELILWIHATKRVSRY
jgi:hypothetical protein